MVIYALIFKCTALMPCQYQQQADNFLQKHIFTVYLPSYRRRRAKNAAHVLISPPTNMQHKFKCTTDLTGYLKTHQQQQHQLAQLKATKNVEIKMKYVTKMQSLPESFFTCAAHTIALPTATTTVTTTTVTTLFCQRKWECN